MSVHRIDSGESFLDQTPSQQEESLAKAKELVVGEAPSRQQPPNTDVTLFRGLWVDGRWHREARVKELTGADEEGIARMLSGTTSLLNALTTYGVESIGPHVLTDMKIIDRTNLIDSLLVGEKELLLLHVLRVTYGDRRTVGVRCPAPGCDAVTDVSFSLSEDVPQRELDDPNRSVYEYTCRDGTNVEYRLVTGGDQAEATRRANATLPEENTIILSRVIVNVNGAPPLDPLHYARNLGAMDRRGLLSDISDHQPGPYFEEVQLPCATCGAASTFQPGWGDLL